VLASDVNYRPGLEVTRASILRSCSDPSRIVWHVFGDAELAACDVSSFAAWNCGSKMAYFRLFLPEFLPGVERVIYSDVDTIWDRDVCELWDLVADDIARDPAHDVAVRWVRDFRTTATYRDYGCSGVCVLNLFRLKAMDFAARCIEYVQAHGTPPYVDQGLMNILLRDDARLLPNVWNVMGDCSNLPPADARCVYHITGIGRHFHDAAAPVYPPQYQFWWAVRTGRRPDVPWRTRILAAIWPFHRLAAVLPIGIRERVVRQWFFAHVLVRRLRDGRLDLAGRTE